VLKLREGIVELYKKVASSIPSDVEEALKKAFAAETAPHIRESLGKILKQVSSSRKALRPLCLDTGIPFFFAWVPRGLSQQHVREVIVEATRIATKKVPLSPNAVDVLSCVNSGDNTGLYFPLIHIEETDKNSLTIDLMLQGSECENLGSIYKLPTSFISNNGGAGDCREIVFERDFEGVKRCVLDAVAKAKGRACPPYTLGIAIGGARDQVAYLSRRQLCGRIDVPNPDERLAALEAEIVREVNEFGKTAEGLSRNVTALGVRVATAHRHPQTYFVDISFSCWANRKARLIW
jgi:tartrate/fumarate subfamily iron-sulfur-dependent hydro-lyase alpha chain